MSLAQIVCRSLQPEEGVPRGIDIWRAAQLMLKRYGQKAEAESTTRGDEVAAGGDHETSQSDGGPPARSSSP